MAYPQYFIDDLKEQLKDANERAEKERDRATRETSRADECESSLRKERARNDELLRINGAMGHELDAAYGYLWAIRTGVETATVPPLPHPPYVIHARFPPTGQPTHDTGVPGTDVNPPIPDHDKIVLNEEISVIGYMTEPDKGVTIITKGGNTFPVTAQGWNAFQQ